MDYQNGNYGYPPYDEDPNASGQDPNAPHPYRDDPAAYGATPVNYGSDASGYGAGNDGYSTAQGNPYGNDYSARSPRTNYGGADPYAQQGAYSDAPADPYSTRRTPRGYDDPDGAYAAHGSARSEEGGYVSRGNTGRTTMPRGDEEYGYASRGNTGRTTMSRGDEEYGYASRGNTGRTTMPRGTEEYGYVSRGNTARTVMQQDDDGYASRGNTSRTRYPQSTRDYDDDGYDREPRAPRSGKKKRSKFGRFMHALGLYLAQMPAKTLVIIGGTFAMALVAVILIALLLPNSERPAAEDNGQLAISDITPTPSIAPTNTPAPTEAITPTPELPALTENISKSGTTSPLMPDIQKRLVELGYMTEPEGGYTTKYGPTTKTAIRLFQVKNFDDSQNWDGIIGKGTYELLMSDQAKAYYLTRGDGDDRTKELTKLVEDVTNLQKRLIELGYLTAGSATGLYGATTVEAVQKFQEYHGLSPIDGKAGQATLKLLYSADAMDATTGKANNKSKQSPSPSASIDPSATTGVTTATTAPTTTTAP